MNTRDKLYEQERLSEGMTELSKAEMRTLRLSVMPAEEAYEYLIKLDTRSFSELLEQIFKGSREELKERLIRGFMEPGCNKESIARKVRGWLSDSYMPTDRIDYIRICFALAMNKEQARRFITLTTGEDFHIREVSECAYLYTLSIGESYEYACSLRDEAESLYKRTLCEDFSASEPRLLNRSWNNSSLSNSETYSEGLHYTGALKAPFAELRTREDFLCYIEEYTHLFGAGHDTAYYHFMRLLDILIQPEEKGEERYSVDSVVNTYLRLGVPLDKATSKYRVLQRTIKKYWPSTTSIVRMRNRTEDVSRRVLLLLYVITEGGMRGDEEDAYLLDEDLTDIERFDEHYCKLNSLMHDCGMATLDPRNTFDWLIIYSLKTNEDNSMSELIEKALRIIFAETE